MKSRAFFRKFACLVILLLLTIFFLSSCGEAAASAKPGKMREPGKSGFGSIRRPFINGVGFTPVKLGETCEYFLVGGLKDEEVRCNINKKLSSFADGIASKSPNDFGKAFSGVKTKGDPLQRNIKIKPLWNANDCLSFAAADGYSNLSANYSSFYGKTLDLRTGAELKLSGLFAGKDFKKIIDDAVSAAIARESVFYNPITEKFEKVLVKASKDYKGVSDNTPFFLSDTGLSIILSPGEVGLSFEGTSDCVVTLGFETFEGNWRIFDSSDPALYTEPKKTRSFVYGGCSGAIIKESTCDAGKNDICVSEELSYPAEFPLSLQKEAERVLEASRPDKEAVLEASKKMKHLRVCRSDIVRCFEIGGFYVIKKETAENMTVPGTWTRSAECRVFDGDLNEIFPKAFLKEKKLETALKKLDTLLATYKKRGSSVSDLKGRDLERPSHRTELLSSSTFEPGPLGVTVYTPCVTIASEGSDVLSSEPLSFFVSYEELGF